MGVQLFAAKSRVLVALYCTRDEAADIPSVSRYLSGAVIQQKVAASRGLSYV